MASADATRHADAGAQSPSAPTESALETAFEVRGAAVVAFQSPEARDGDSRQYRFVETDPANKQALLEAHYLHQSAFFLKLRIPVRLKRLDNTFLYFYIPSHHISSLDWATDADEGATDLGVIQNKLNGGGGGVTRLDVGLHTPGQLVVPAAQGSLEPKKPATACVIESLTSLATALVFSLYVPHTVFSKARLQLLKAAIGSLPSARRPLLEAAAGSPPSDLRSLYNGKGGKQWLPAEIDDGTASTASDSAASTVAVDTPPGYGPPPPRYDEIETGTTDSVQKRKGKRPRYCVSSGSSDGSPSARPSKKGSVWGAEPPAPADEKTPRDSLFAQMEVLVRAQHEYIQQQQTHILQQQEHIKRQEIDIKRLMASTEGLEQQVAVMQERLDEAGVKVEDLDAGLVELGQDLDEVRCSVPDSEDIVQDLGNQIEHEVREQVERRLQEVFTRIGNAITD